LRSFSGTFIADKAFIETQNYAYLLNAVRGLSDGQFDSGALEIAESRKRLAEEDRLASCGRRRAQASYRISPESVSGGFAIGFDASRNRSSQNLELSDVQKSGAQQHLFELALCIPRLNPKRFER
jgi:hypothetical protein